MRKYWVIAASFFSMLCLGGVYGWSIIASELIKNYGYSAAQTQVIFGTLIGVFPTTMIFVGQFAKKIAPRGLVTISSILFLCGYLLAGFADGNFLLVFLGIGILGGISTGFGYWVFLTIPVQWFPQRKGLITGISVAGFGFGAVALSRIIEYILPLLENLSQFFVFMGISYGLTLFLLSAFIAQPPQTAPSNPPIAGVVDQPRRFLFEGLFYKLFLGIFCGTFAGLMVIGSLKMIGEQYPIANQALVLGVTLFAIANFLGRIFWGSISDYIGASLSIFLALTIQAVTILLLGNLILNSKVYLLLAFLIGFSFGGNFVLFAKETAQVYGVQNLGVIYPYVFLGYAVAGISGPSIGGALFDQFGSFSVAILLASSISLAGGVLFLHHSIQLKKASLKSDELADLSSG